MCLQEATLVAELGFIHLIQVLHLSVEEKESQRTRGSCQMLLLSRAGLRVIFPFRLELL